jgi:hypothetical protein
VPILVRILSSECEYALWGSFVSLHLLVAYWR